MDDGPKTSVRVYVCIHIYSRHLLLHLYVALLGLGHTHTDHPNTMMGFSFGFTFVSMNDREHSRVQRYLAIPLILYAKLSMAPVERNLLTTDCCRFFGIGTLGHSVPEVASFS